MNTRLAMHTCAGIVTCLVVQACGWLSAGRDYSAWEGHTVTELTDAWGAPASRRDLSSDAAALTWRFDRGACEVTFFSTEGRITGYSDTGC